MLRKRSTGCHNKGLIRGGPGSVWTSGKSSPKEMAYDLQLPSKGGKEDKNGISIEY